MINSNVFDYINVLDKAADASWTRNEIIANNIANIDTPGYKRQDLNFEDELESANLMLEFNGRWFYKAPGTKFIDLMPALFEKPVKGKTTLDLKMFAPPADGKNDPSQGKDWMINYYYTVKALPRIRIEYLPVASKKRK